MCSHLKADECHREDAPRLWSIEQIAFLEMISIFIDVPLLGFNTIHVSFSPSILS
jgi:hypothetical protein